jgi:hypothetical protein
MPTHSGDVLILLTSKTCFPYAVGEVSKDSQQDFGSEFNVMHFAGLAEALRQAKALVVPGRRIYLLNIDTGDWALVSGGENRM